MIVYLVTYSDYDVYEILGSYSKKEDAEAHVALEKESSKLQKTRSCYPEIEELEISSETPSLYYAHEADWRGSRESSNIWIGSKLPETFLSPEKAEDALYPYAQAFGWTREEAKTKLEEALGTEL
jgi:hypothetical protein